MCIRDRARPAVRASPKRRTGLSRAWKPPRVGDPSDSAFSPGGTARSAAHPKAGPFGGAMLKQMPLKATLL
eukprot:1678261-Alexandrium_andersonii.AAC.1